MKTNLSQPNDTTSPAAAQPRDFSQPNDTTSPAAAQPRDFSQPNDTTSPAAAQPRDPSPVAWLTIAALYPEANFLQSPAWREVNRLIGHKTILESGDDFWCLMIVKNARRGRYLEVPGGPLVDWKNSARVNMIFRHIRAVAKAEGCVFVRLRPQLEASPENLELMRRLGARPAPMHLHAEHTVIINLEPSEDDLLKNLRKQTRYEVRRAEKLGITVEWGNSEELFREFHVVQTETAARQHFIPPNLKTLLAERTAFNAQPSALNPGPGRKNQPSAPNPDRKNTPSPDDTLNPDPDSSETAARLYVARTPEGAAIAYGLILIDGAEAEYFEAASTALGRKLPGAYALQWRVIRDLKTLGIRRYNLWGIAPQAPNRPPKSPNHPQKIPNRLQKSLNHPKKSINPIKPHRYSGVTTFKTGFGGEIVEYLPAHDLVLKPARYALDWIIETIRKKMRKL